MEEMSDPVQPLGVPPISAPLPPEPPLPSQPLQPEPVQVLSVTPQPMPSQPLPVQPAPTQPVLRVPTPPNLSSSALFTSQPMTLTQTIADYLLQNGSISQATYDELSLERINTGKTLDVLIEEKGLVDEEVLAKAKSAVFNIPFIDLTDTGVQPQALAQVKETIAKHYGVLPFLFDKEHNTLSVAMRNPLNLEAIDFLEKKTGKRIVVYFASPSVLERQINERYAQSLSSEVESALKEQEPEKTVTGVELKSFDAKELSQVIREAPIAKIVETVLSYAVKARASDIHIEPQIDKTRVRYRIDGILHEKLLLPKSVQDAVVSRIKVLADLKIDEKRIPQDGRFTFRIDKEETDLRVSTLPTVHGEKIVMRLLKKTGGVPTLQDLGLRGIALKHLEESIRIPHGIILVTGPTGSGKTTTLYSVLHNLNTAKVNIVTLEDPVEYQMNGINQVQINPQAGLTFASGLRSFLRQDPNIIMVGEIRDSETAELTIQASLTGHLVFSTLHTNSAAGALPRLLDMGAEPFLLASSITLVMAQRVVRRVCDSCKEEIDADPTIVEDMKTVLGDELYQSTMKSNLAKPKLWKGRGCEECGGSGYKGRVGIYEVLVVNEKIGRMILERKPANALQDQAMHDGMILMKQDGYLKAIEGMTTIEEVLRVAQTSAREASLEEVEAAGQISEDGY